MTEEKILDSEILDDEELEGVRFTQENGIL